MNVRPMLLVQTLMEDTVAHVIQGTVEMDLHVIVRVKLDSTTSCLSYHFPN